MPEINRGKILAGRQAVEAYRTAHSKLYSKGWHKGIPEEHTPLLNIMLGAFKGLGFNSLQEFFDASELLNIQELGFSSKEAFRVALEKDAIRDKDDNIIELSPEGQVLQQSLQGMWQ